MHTQSKSSSPIMDRRSLSQRLTGLLDESKKLLQLRADWGRMPKGPVREQVLKQIDEWFKGDETVTTKAENRVSIDFGSVQELWDAYGTVCQPILREGLDAIVIQRLEDEGYSPADSVPDEDDIPF